MSIVGQIQVESRRFSGWLDPRYPIGFWLARLSVTGDASGGTLSVELVFQSAVGPVRLNSQMYSVERFGINTNESTNRIARLVATNMGGPSNLGFAHEYSIALDQVTGLPSSAMIPFELNLVPWFLGSQRTPAVTASLNLVVDNIDGRSFQFEAEGYRWSPRSVLVDGGPQRPPTGLYRQ